MNRIGVIIDYFLTIASTIEIKSISSTELAIQACLHPGPRAGHFCVHLALGVMLASFSFVEHIRSLKSTTWWLMVIIAFCKTPRHTLLCKLM